MKLLKWLLKTPISAPRQDLESLKTGESPADLPLEMKTPAVTAQCLPADPPSESCGEPCLDGRSAEVAKVDASSNDIRHYPGSRPARSQAPRRSMSHYERLMLRMAKLEARGRRHQQVKSQRQRAARARRERILGDYLEALRLRRHQCLNSWGCLDREDWNRVMEQFLRSVLRVAQADVPRWKKEINHRLGRSRSGRLKTPAGRQGACFEMEISLEMRRLGWTVQLLGQSGDQGGDLLAQKGGKSVVIQCKKYTSRVGNAAVQEVIAARQFYKASRAAVVAQSGFTRQAKQLAYSADVFLLSSDQLSFLG